MPVALSIVSMTVSTRFTDRIITLTFSGAYTQFGLVTNAVGENVNFSTMTNPSRIDGALQFSQLPIAIYMMSDSGGYYFEVIKSQIATGATLANYRVKIYQPTGAELAAGAYPAALTAPAAPFQIGIQTVTGK